MATKTKIKLSEGDTAPDFTAPINGGDEVSLSQFRGQTVVLYFYPKDNTPGCNKEACGFRDAHTEIAAKNAVVLGDPKTMLPIGINRNQLLSLEEGIQKTVNFYKKKISN